MSGGDARVAGLRRDSEELFRVRVLEELRAQRRDLKLEAERGRSSLIADSLFLSSPRRIGGPLGGGRMPTSRASSRSSVLIRLLKTHFKEEMAQMTTQNRNLGTNLSNRTES